MSFRKHILGSKGFSLVELMIVVAIIGVLAALAVPRFQSFQAKARQSEAKNNLSHIYTLQQSYFGDNDKYSPVRAAGDTIGPGPTKANCEKENPIGFNPQPCAKVRYGYWATMTADDDFDARAKAPAKKIVPGCDAQDEWSMNQTKDLAAVNDSVATCK